MSNLFYRRVPGIASNILRNVTPQFTCFRTSLPSQQRGFLHETGFSRPTLLPTNEYSSEYSLFMPYSTISFLID